MRKIYSPIVLLFILFSDLPAQVIYNAYANISAVTGSTLLTVNNVNQVNHTFNVNELVIVMQMQDNAIGTNTTNVSTFGDLGSIQNTGRFEVARILAVNLSAGTPTSIALANNLVNTYNTGTNTSVQLISFRRLSPAAFTTTNNITALPWNGTIGGVVALEVVTTLTLAHSISADGLGFTGGPKNNPNFASTSCDATYVTSIGNKWAGKGEGIYKNTNTALAGARGKMLNAGGGGTDENSGGGGGGNYTSGGNGGVGYNGGSGCSPSVCGIGGLSLSSFINASRVYMGGGGGGGHENNSVGSAGGAGGGIILLKANALVTTGACSAISITANGATAADGVNDGCGGGGGAGSIVLQINTYSLSNTCTLTVTSNGGNGGSSVTSAAHGGGGGGGQGVVIYSSAQPTVNVSTSTLPGTGGSSCVGCASSVNGVPGTGPNNSGIISTTTGVLPIELLYFKATEAEERNLLKWATATEHNTDHFLIERSTNAIDWKSVAQVKAAVNSASMRNYSIYDEAPLFGLSYYRLKAVDLDLSYQYSNIEILERENNDPFTVFPNPNNGTFSLKLKHYSQQPVLVKIFDAVGKLVYNDVLKTEEGKYEYQFINSFGDGVYTIKIDGGQKTYNYKMVVIK